VAPDATLKVILETGRLAEPARIAAAARAAIMGGCDMLKTSTGKVSPGATLEAAAVLLAVLEEADGRVGIKVAGGIRTTQQAAQYLSLVDQLLGSGWTSPATFRFGASALLEDLLKILRSG
jgi:deoxyribose-phosphate aldolase